ncbi:MAG: hypothetical protein ACK4TK_01570 [Thiobacillaceae bacterium]
MPRLPSRLALATALVSAQLVSAAPLNGTDNRIPINVTSQERSHLLAEMCTFLQGLHNIFHALARKDMKAVAVEARPLGKVLHHMPPGMRERVPLAYVEMGWGLHEVFDVIARDDEAKADPALTLGQLAEALSYCSGCHDTYRLQVVPARGAR